MFIEERHDKIIKLLNDKGRIKARDLQAMFDIGFDTARRDLRILEEKGLLKRTHGGAIPLEKIGSAVSNNDLSLKDTDFSIVKEAVKLVSNQDVIYISGGHLGCHLAKLLPEDLECTIVTNAIDIAEILRKRNKKEVFILGGRLDRDGVCNHHFTELMIKSMRFDISFISNATLSWDFGLSVNQSDSISIIKAVMATSRKSIGIFSHDQMARTSLMQVCPIESFDMVITDWDTVVEEVEAIKERQVQVIVADQHEAIYRQLRDKGFSGWGGSKYDDRMTGWDKDLKKLFEVTKQKKVQVLELGCGAGDVAIKLSQMGHKVTGLDISQTAIEWAKQKSEKYDIDYVVSSASDQTILLDQQYDLVLDGTCLHCLFDDDRTNFYKNVKRLLKSNGYFFVSSVILKHETAETPQVSMIERCVLSEENLRKELINEGFSEVKVWSKRHEKHGHMWGVYQYNPLKV